LQYDWRSFGAVPKGAIALIFGYGTACFQLRLRLKGIRHAVNMDGIEWQRQKWSPLARRWLRLNERAAVKLSDLLISDHPQIQCYLKDSLRANSTMIAYGVDMSADSSAVDANHPVLSGQAERPYFLVIARPEPENQVHVLLEAYMRSRSDQDLLVVGNFDANSYGAELKRSYAKVRFVGPVYEMAALNALRQRATLYLHGHSVGGTNPSLIEAMAAGALVAAHDNPFNRWVLGNDGGIFFSSADDLSALMAAPPSPQARSLMIGNARQACEERYLWRDILSDYQGVVDRLIARPVP
jgi:glycosyltransferase involved in cell wall biosynthesis